MSVIETALLGGLGTLIGKYFQDRSEMKARMRQIRSHELEIANDIFSKLSKQMDEYVYRMKEVYNGYNYDVDNNEKEQRLKNFLVSQSEWESTLNLEYSKVSMYFGEKMGTAFKDVFCRQFTLLRQELDKIIYDKVNINEMPKNENNETKFIFTWNRIIILIRKFNIGMLKLIEEESIGALRKYAQ
ncbi:MAG TPA: hypothetical protein VK469_20375 [Candidatus Kapabacteria bacterium]|nr:hypothetical protein [Candidatus Kapabacteria bacterium]